MKKVAVVVLAMALLMTFAAVPVMAEPTKGLKVTASLTIIGPPELRDPGTGRFTESGVFQGRGGILVFPVMLVIGGTTYDAVSVFVYDWTWNPQTRVMLIRCDVVMYIPSEGSPDGFSGNSEIKYYGMDSVTSFPTSVTTHEVSQGFGSFVGQTLMTSYEGPPLGTETGYCLKG